MSVARVSTKIQSGFAARSSSQWCLPKSCRAAERCSCKTVPQLVRSIRCLLRPNWLAWSRFSVVDCFALRLPLPLAVANKDVSSVASDHSSARVRSLYSLPAVLDRSCSGQQRACVLLPPLLWSSAHLFAMRARSHSSAVLWNRMTASVT